MRLGWANNMLSINVSFSWQKRNKLYKRKKPAYYCKGI